ncbi:MAG: hypothetical protein JSV96_03705 [Candidatus Aminicenantes bacterium]|nr:MAG: hypothetical protein JSV96_03705 [Candidatus Aminicenantes bacterium]
MKWGRWVFNPETFSLTTEIVNERKIFSLPLSRFNSVSEILDWIVIIHDKTWTTNKDIGDLFEALNDLLDFQSNFSSIRKEIYNKNEDYAKVIIERRLRLNERNNYKKTL